MSLFKQKLDEMVKLFTKALMEADLDKAKIAEVRIQFLGRKGAFAQLMDTFKTLSIEEKRTHGNSLQTAKVACEQALQEKELLIQQKELEASTQKTQSFDPTAYIHQNPGRLHPLTLTEHQFIKICTDMGFVVAYGPELETEWYNFDALNIPENHPARDFWDTIWIDIPHLLLRTHTSPVQIRALEIAQGPIALIAPGRCYRHEATDATHDYMFMQLEGLVLGEHISMSNLIATVENIMTTFFKQKNSQLRIRPSYFPFVEPGIEIDMSCPFCTQGCTVCKKSGFIEMGGAGMIHPEVLRAAKIDPRYTGFAFGFGLTRLAMLQYHVPDIRLFYTNEYEFLRQF